MFLRWIIWHPHSYHKLWLGAYYFTCLLITLHAPEAASGWSIFLTSYPLLLLHSFCQKQQPKKEEAFQHWSQRGREDEGKWDILFQIYVKRIRGWMNRPAFSFYLNTVHYWNCLLKHINYERPQILIPHQLMAFGLKSCIHSAILFLSAVCCVVQYEVQHLALNTELKSILSIICCTTQSICNMLYYSILRLLEKFSNNCSF